MENISNICSRFGAGLMMVSALSLWTACDDSDDAPKLQLDAPAVTVDSISYNALGFSWTPVEGAYEYQYELRDENNVLAEGDLVKTTSVFIEGLDAETTYTLSVVAYAQDAMNSIGSEAGTATATTDVAPVPEEPGDGKLWSVKGTYTSAELGQSWTATLVAYDDNHYEIESWYGVEGYNIQFTLNADNSLNMTDYYEVDAYSYFVVPTGRTDYSISYVYLDWGCSAFKGDATEGQIYLYSYLVSGGYDYFNWGAGYGQEDNSGSSDSNTGSAITLASLAGTYSEHTTGYWNATCDYTCDVTIQVTDEATQTIVLKGFSGSSEDLTGTVDLDAKTITFEPKQSFASYYLFSAEADITTAVVGTIADDGTITINDWGAWYPWNGVYYSYSTGMASTLTKQ